MIIKKKRKEYSNDYIIRASLFNSSPEEYNKVLSVLWESNIQFGYLNLIPECDSICDKIDEMVKVLTLVTPISVLKPKYLSDYLYLVGIGVDVHDYMNGNKPVFDVKYSSDLYKLSTNKEKLGAFGYNLDSMSTLELVNSIEYTAKKYRDIFSGLTEELTLLLMEKCVSVDQLIGSKDIELGCSIGNKIILPISIKNRCGRRLSSEAILTKIKIVKKLFGIEKAYPAVRHMIIDNHVELLIGEKPVYDEFMSAGYELVKDIQTDDILPSSYIIMLDGYIRAENMCYPYLFSSKRGYAVALNRYKTVYFSGETELVSYGSTYCWYDEVREDYRCNVSRLFNIKVEEVDNYMFYLSNNKEYIIDYIDVVDNNYNSIIDILRDIYDVKYTILCSEKPFITKEFTFDYELTSTIINYLKKLVTEGKLKMVDDEKYYDDSYSNEYTDDEEDHSSDEFLDKSFDSEIDIIVPDTDDDTEDDDDSENNEEN